MSRDSNLEAFFALVRAGLWEKEVRLLPFGMLDYEEILRLAEEQSVVGLVTAGLEQVKDVKVPQTDLLQFIGQSLQLEQRNLTMNNFIAEIVEKMRAVGIYTLLVKGQGIAQCYERPLYRSSGDIDFLLSEENYIKAQSLLMPLATSVEAESRRHQGMTIDTWEVEIHGHLHSGLSYRIDNVIDEAQRDVFYGGNVRPWLNGFTQVFIPGVDNDVIFVFTHFLKHFYKGGLGLRQICDWCRLLWTFREKLNRGLLESRIRKAGLISEWKAFGAFAVEYLGMDAEAMPLYNENYKLKRRVERIKDFIVMSGNFGHNRDLSNSRKYPYLVRKCCSMWMRLRDLTSHARIFPVDSIMFIPRVICNGVRSALKGIG